MKAVTAILMVLAFAAMAPACDYGVQAFSSGYTVQQFVQPVQVQRIMVQQYVQPLAIQKVRVQQFSHSYGVQSFAQPVILQQKSFFRQRSGFSLNLDTGSRGRVIQRSRLILR